MAGGSAAGPDRGVPSPGGWFRRLPWKVVAAVIGALSAVPAVVALFVPTPIFGPPRGPDLHVSSFEVGEGTRTMEVTSDSPDGEVVDAFDAEVARVQVGLRNRGGEPAYVTEAMLTVTAHEPLESCAEVGGPVYVSEVVDVELPFETPSLPWVHEQPMSFQVLPGEVDRLELTFGMTGVPIARQPVLVSVEVALVQDTARDPVEVGTAKLLVPAIGARVALDSLSEDPLLTAGRTGTTQEIRECNLRNGTRVRAFLEAPTRTPEGVAPSLVRLVEAHDAFTEGRFYVAPE